MKRLFSYTLLLVEWVNFRSRMLAFRGAGGEPPRHAWAYLRGLTCPANPAGVEHPSAPINKCGFFNICINSNNLLEKSL
ncbi:hypothetical protein AB986_10900 [Alkalihalobacillus macyae]|uniref:Uncharacterized protein n=1 Tax=Guptibacillus hwajinpoensis TaxID=208199 RepID=A0A0J6CTF9_9BACL|nr:hypothetical protein AB986_10900 [Alkalihalobacillus macyae]